MANETLISNLTVDGTNYAIYDAGALRSDEQIPASLLPSFVDDVVEGYYSGYAFYKDAGETQAITGEQGKIYVDLNTNLTYRYTGSQYIEVSSRTYKPVSNTEAGLVPATDGLIRRKLVSKLEDKDGVSAEWVLDTAPNIVPDAGRITGVTEEADSIDITIAYDRVDADWTIGNAYVMSCDIDLVEKLYTTRKPVTVSGTKYATPNPITFTGVNFEGFYRTEYTDVLHNNANYYSLALAKNQRYLLYFYEDRLVEGRMCCTLLSSAPSESYISALGFKKTDTHGSLKGTYTSSTKTLSLSIS